MSWDDAEENRPDIYEYFGTYSNEDARRLLDAFIRSEVEYTLDVDDIGIRNMSVFRAINGGTFGAGIGVAIGVHIGDLEQAMEIRQRVLKIRL